jgi:hypothetical protein
MPAPVTPLLGFALGVACAWAAVGDLGRSTSGLGGRALLLTTAFALLVFAPVAGYFVAFEPDWSFAYFVDSERLPTAVPIAVVLVAAASVPAGFLAAVADARAHRLGRVLRKAAVPAALAAVFLLATFSRLSVHANYAQFHGDFGTRGVAGGPLGYALIWMLGVLAAATAWTLRALQRMSRES